MKGYLIFILLGISLVIGSVQAQPLPMTTAAFSIPERSEIRQGRLVGVIVGSAVFYAATLVFLRKAWYRKSVPFHVYNDNDNWLQMDKAGHATTAYAMSRGGYELFRWSGVNERTSVLTGGLLALLFQTTLEVLDGHSANWGFSKIDMLANVAGTALFMGQQYGFGAQKVNLRFGYRASIYPYYRPDALGRTWGMRMLKDYNGQQYWLSVNLASVLPVGPAFPRWLNLDVGYSGSGMTGGRHNPALTDSAGRAITFRRYRQFYVSPDADLSVFSRTSSLDRFIRTAQFFKLPAPSVEYNRLQGVRFNPFFIRND